MDNQSAEPAALAYLKELELRASVRVVPYDHPFNFAAINNEGIRQARGEVVVMLNNDTEVISPDWLEEMLGHLARDGVGAEKSNSSSRDSRDPCMARSRAYTGAASLVLLTEWRVQFHWHIKSP